MALFDSKPAQCSHKWGVPLSTFYVTGRPAETLPTNLLDKLDASIFQEYVYGTTTVYQQCEQCGVMQGDKVIGHFTANGVPETL